MKKRLLISLAVVLLLLVAVYAAALRPALKIANGYYAKILASAVFVAGRPPESVQQQELAFLSMVQANVAMQAYTVTASVAGLGRATALYRPGVGVTLVHDALDDITAQPLPAPMIQPQDYPTLAWPEGNAPGLTAPDPGIDLAKLDAAIDIAFKETNPEKRLNTRAVVVVHNGKLIAERYAESFTSDTRLAGWSMTKSVINALVGILVREGKMDIMQPAPVPEWREAGDPRSAVTTDQLLRMSSGLEFSEEYFNPFSSATQMLFGSTDAAAVAAALPLAHEPDTAWYYSSGTTNILSRMVRQSVGEDDYRNFANRELFAPIGMFSALIEPDASGTGVGSSFGWATARDWARFAKLYLDDGMWQGVRILPEGWVAYSKTPTPPAPQGEYGAQWWLNAGTAGNPADRPLPNCPTDLMYASGFEGQRAFALPSHNAVVVRLGLTQGEGIFPWDAFISSILATLPEKTPAP